MKYPFLLALCCWLSCVLCNAASGAIVVSGFFSGTVERFDAVTKAQTTLATIANNPGLSGIAYNRFNDQLYVSALNHGGVYRLDARSGAVLGFTQLGIGPGGLAVAPNGNIYISDFTSNSVRIFDASLTTAVGVIATPDGTVTSGVGFSSNGEVFIATAGAGVFRYDGTSLTQFTDNPAASAQIAVDSQSRVFVGHGLGFSDLAFSYDATGQLLGTLNVTDAMVNSTGSGSSTGTSPSGIAIDADGNVLVAALGRSNPSDPGGQRGGLFKFDVNGNLLDTFASGSFAFSGIAVVPEPSVLGALLLGSLALLSGRRRR